MTWKSNKSPVSNFIHEAERPHTDAVFAEVWRGAVSRRRPIPRKFRLFTRGTRYRGAVLLSSVALRRICQRMTNARDMEPVAEPAGPLSSPEQLLPPAECDGHR